MEFVFSQRFGQTPGNLNGGGEVDAVTGFSGQQAQSDREMRFAKGA